MASKTSTEERCALCRCALHRSGEYATPTVEGRSHATEHHYVAERFFGRSKNRANTQREGIFADCPWGCEGKTAVYCYECHEELLHNPVLLPADISAFARLIELRELHEETKPANRDKLAGRIRLFRSVIAAGLDSLLNDAVSRKGERSQASTPSIQQPETTEEACSRVHTALDRLPRWSSPAEVPFRNGLYFFYERGETSLHSSNGRIVRIGNHPRSDDSLVRRLRQHYSGQKNGSVFRKFLGGALIRSEDTNSACLLPSPGRGHWEKQDAAPCDLCKPVEVKVSTLLREKFSFRCVEVRDRQQRNRLEDGLIATVSACSDCKPTATWLGLRAYSPIVRTCGMWNSDSVGGRKLSQDELKCFEALVDETAKRWNLEPNS